MLELPQINVSDIIQEIRPPKKDIGKILQTFKEAITIPPPARPPQGLRISVQHQVRKG